MKEIKMSKLSFQKGDWLAVAMVVTLGLVVSAFFGNNINGSKAEMIQIYRNNQCIMELSLQEDDIVSVDGIYSNVIEISDGKAAIVESDCPGKDCVHSGWISRAGRSIVCLPNKVEVRIVGSADDVDFVVR